jgi:two-component system, chemotaxis family, CheB/CheR fusion protein
LQQQKHPGYENIIPEMLQKVTSVPVAESINAVQVTPKNIYVLPASKMFKTKDCKLKLTPGPELSRVF